MKGIIAWFAENHVTANLLMLFFVIAGIVTGLSIKLEVFPENSLDTITVNVEYPGASPAEVEEAILTRIEEKVAGLEGVKEINSIAREGLGSVIIEVIRNWDIKKLLDDVKAEVDRLTTLPKEAEKPIITEITMRSQVLFLTVYGDADESTIKYISEKLRDDLTNLPGITQAELIGVRTREIHIDIPEETLRRYGLTLGLVANIVSKSSYDLPAGRIKSSNGEILIRTKGKRYFAKDYADIAILTQPDGSKVTLGQIADLTDGYEDIDMSLRFQGKPAAAISVFRVADQNALEVAKIVKNYVKEVEPTMPEGIMLSIWDDRSELLKSRLNLLLKNMTIGLILVSTLLGLFLNIRLAFWITLGIPISFLFGLILLPRYDVSINMISLFAFIMVLGIVVDDAIVIGENIYRKHEKGFKPLKASIEGAYEVGRPVIFSVLTTMVAFWPLLLGTGMMGKIMKEIPIVVMVVLLGSLVESLLILPAHLQRSKISANQKGRDLEKERKISELLAVIVNGPYARLLSFCTKWKYATVGCSIMFLLITLGLWTGGLLKFTFFPKVDSDILICTLTMPAGTPVEETTNVVDYLEKCAREALSETDRERDEDATPLFQKNLSMVGLHLTITGPNVGEASRGGHLAQIFIEILKGEDRDVSATKLTRLWREKVGSVPEAESITFQSELMHTGNAVEVHLSLEDNEMLIVASEDLKKELSEYPGVFDISDSFLPGKMEMQLKLKPTARSLGITLNELAQQVRSAFYGAEALRLQLERDEVKVLVRYPDSERKSLGKVEDMRIRKMDLSEIPFKQVAEVDMQQGYTTIERSQRRRVIKVTADIDESVTNANEVRKYLEGEFLPELGNRYVGLRYSMEGEGKEQKESMADVFRGFIIALFGIYALLAIPFKSFTQPFIIMIAIPFGIVGALLGHLIMGHNVSFLSFFGIVGLAGVVVNDAIVLIDRANRLKKEGEDVYTAVNHAGKSRFRAILLTSLTTFAGLTPIMLERSLQAQFLIPMAISLAFGVLFATVITLFLIPCFYLIHNDILSFFPKYRT